MSATNELPKGAAALEGLIRALRDPAGLEGAYASAVVDVARLAAAGRPTPQSRLAAQALAASGPTITARGPLLWGSEFGSDIYRQFGRRNSRGYWLFPSLEDNRATDAADRSLADLVEDVARHA